MGNYGTNEAKPPENQSNYEKVDFIQIFIFTKLDRFSIGKCPH